jgi:hypothetical protein
MHITLKDYILGLVPAALQCAIAVIIFRRKLFRLFPAFTAYTICQIICTLVVYVELTLQISSLHYAYTFYPLQVGSMGSPFGVIYSSPWFS